MRPLAKGAALVAAAALLGVVWASPWGSPADARSTAGQPSELAGIHAPIAHTSQVEEDEPALPVEVAAPIRQGRTALKAVKARIHLRLYAAALKSIGVVGRKVARAHEAGLAQIGAPPPDPESDDLPGPPSVIAVLDFEHVVTAQFVPLFANLQKTQVTRELGSTLTSTDALRNHMLDAVIALNPEEEGADYADGMADTLPIYTAEVTAMRKALKLYRLSSTGRVVLRAALVRARKTLAKVNAAFGGGE
jgi:hypothetical protein